MKRIIVLFVALMCLCNKNPASTDSISFIDGTISTIFYDTSLGCWDIRYPEQNEIMANIYLRAHPTDGWNEPEAFNLVVCYVLDTNTVLIFDENKNLSNLPFEYRIVFFQ
jgi:hypothetical protein